MKIINPVIIIIILISTCLIAYAAPKIPEKDIPADIPEEVRGYIIKLYAQSASSWRNAIRKLGEMGENAAPAVPFLIDMLGDDTMTFKYTYNDGVWSNIGSYLAEDTAKSLLQIGEPAFMPLIEALKNDDPNVRKYAVYTLGLFKDTRAVEALINTLGDDDPIVRRFASKALSDITGEKFGEDKGKWLSWWKEKNK